MKREVRCGDRSACIVYALMTILYEQTVSRCAGGRMLGPTSPSGVVVVAICCLYVYTMVYIYIYASEVKTVANQQKLKQNQQIL